MSDHANKNNLRKLSFLGFAKGSASNLNDGSSSQNEPELDEECAKVFAMDDNNEKFNVDKLHDSSPAGQPKNIGENEYSMHRKRSYPHMHTPLKKPTKRRPSNPQVEQDDAAPEAAGETTSPDSATVTSGATHTPTSVRSPVFKMTDSDTGLLSSFTLQEEDDTGGLSSESEYILSDPAGHRSPPDDSSPDRKVQFQKHGQNGGTANAYDDRGEEKKDKRHRRGRHHHTHHSKIRKYSLPDEAGRRHDGRGRRISTQPEDMELRGADRDQLESHRSDDPRALRRHKARPAPAKETPETIPAAVSKRVYDRKPNAIFVQLDELDGNQDEREWKETARWIKYEENVEEGVDRWGKPHVASLSFHSLLNLRKCLEDGIVIMDMEEKDLPGIAYRISEEMYKEDLITEGDKARIMRVLLLKHRHVHEHHERGFRFPKKQSYTSLQSLHELERKRSSLASDIINAVRNGGHVDTEGKLIGSDGHTMVDMKEETYTVSTDDLNKAQNEAIFKRIPEGAQGSSILVGKVDFLDQPAMAFVRLAEGVHIPFLFEVNIPVRFFFVLLGPPEMPLDYHEIGRSISTLMANPQFHSLAYSADNRKVLLSAINEFLDDSIVLPPGDWEHKELLPIEELKAKSEAIRKRKETAIKKMKEAELESSKPLLEKLAAGGDDEPPFGHPLVRTKRPFGGLINDIRRRYPYFKSDFTDALNSPTLAASLFMYFAALSTAITFGGLCGDKTNNLIGVSETLISGAVGGVIFHLFSGQPLIITGTTGPLILFEAALLQFCNSNGFEFLNMRVYIGIWLAIIALTVALFEGSVFVKLFSRFTEDIYSALISLIYIIESIQKLVMGFQQHPLLTLEEYCNISQTATCPNSTVGDVFNETLAVTLQPPVDCKDDVPFANHPNTALMCVILALGTFSIAYYLRIFRNGKFLGRSARRALGDFGVPIAIVIMAGVDVLAPQTMTDKLIVPDGIEPTRPNDRGWLINPAGDKKPFPIWLMFAACVPAMLVYILIFMETHICELIVGKKERKMKKGGGFHLDVVILCIINIGNGFFGCPWLCAATVRSIAHVASVTIMSRTHAPGEKAHIIEVKEQRVSGLFVSVFMGLSVLMTALLRLIPMSVLFGVFLYMGISSTSGVQFFERCRLFFMPVKHHPSVPYVRKVKTIKMHIFTCSQIFCLSVLWIVKSTKASLAFPFFLLLMIPLRAQMKKIFTPVELNALDGDQVIDDDDDEPDFYAEAPLPG